MKIFSSEKAIYNLYLNQMTSEEAVRIKRIVEINL